MKQTAVEWFFWKLYVLKEVEYESIMELYQQAKEMEKEQIRDAYRDGRSDQQSARNGKFYSRMAEQYYNETFKSE